MVFLSQDSLETSQSKMAESKELLYPVDAARDPAEGMEGRLVLRLRVWDFCYFHPSPTVPSSYCGQGHV